MGGSDQGTKIEESAKKEPAVSRTQQHFMKILEEQNKERARRLIIQRRRNLYIAGGLGCAVLGIYGYSIYAVRQERFLDDFEEPEKIVQ